MNLIYNNQDQDANEFIVKLSKFNETEGEKHVISSNY